MAERPFGHEPSAIRTRRVLALVGVLLALVVVAVAALHFVERGMLPNHAGVVDRPGLAPPPPRLQPHPDADIAAERAQKYRLLHSYQWLDAGHAHARIPIDRAMQLYLARHATAPRASGDAAGGARP